jgi:hypothetical protein
MTLETFFLTENITCHLDYSEIIAFFLKFI